MPDPATRANRRRAVLNDARRKVESALRVADAADELAQAAQAVLSTPDSRRVELEGKGLDELRAALARYHAARHGAS